MLKSNKITLGQTGESLARSFLLKLGYQVLGQNVRLGRKEVDLIVRDREHIVFVEVKTKYEGSCGRAEDEFTRDKARHLKQAALMYFHRYRLYKKYDLGRVRFDLVAININPRTNLLNISHYIDII